MCWSLITSHLMAGCYITLTVHVNVKCNTKLLLNTKKITYPLRLAICSGKEHAPLLTSGLRERIHLTISTLLIPTHLWSRLYPSSLWTNRMFSFCNGKDFIFLTRWWCSVEVVATAASRDDNNNNDIFHKIHSCFLH
jgi:hypothetical protein